MFDRRDLGPRKTHRSVEIARYIYTIDKRIAVMHHICYTRFVNPKNGETNIFVLSHEFFEASSIEVWLKGSVDRQFLWMSRGADSFTLPSTHT